MAQQLRAHLSKDSSSVSNSLSSSQPSIILVLGNMTPSSGLVGEQEYMWCSDMYKQIVIQKK